MFFYIFYASNYYRFKERKDLKQTGNIMPSNENKINCAETP